MGQLEHFQQKCVAVLRRIMRKNKEIEQLPDSVFTGTALSAGRRKSKRPGNFPAFFMIAMN